MNRTKQEISETLWQLLDEKPYSKITVQNIVERCKINRSTFYYHFSDIPTVLDYAITSWADRIIVQGNGLRFPANCICPIAKECIKRRQACLNIYRSVQRDGFLALLNRTVTCVLTSYADQVLKEPDTSEQERELLLWSSRCMLSGVILDWFDAGMSYDVTKRMEELSALPNDNPAVISWLPRSNPTEH